MKKLINLISILFALSFASLSFSAEDEGEVIVIDDMSKSQLRAEIRKIETEFYKVFNANNDSDKLDIECSSYTPTGSHRPRRACEPQFLVDARGRNTNQSRQGDEPLLTMSALRGETAVEFEELTAAMNKLLKENEYFAQLNSILGMLKERQAEL